MILFQGVSCEQRTRKYILNTEIISILGHFYHLENCVEDEYYI